MPTTKYCVVRTDKPSGEAQMADMVSVRFYTTSGSGSSITYTAAEVENGVIAELKGLDPIDQNTNEHEIYRAVAATSSSNMNDCVIICSPELLYDERKKLLDQFINEAGKPARGYIPRSRNIYSWTKEGFVGGTAPTIGATVGIGANGKLDASGSGFGKCIDIDTAGRYTYYAIEIGVTEA